MKNNVDTYFAYAKIKLDSDQKYVESGLSLSEGGCVELFWLNLRITPRNMYKKNRWRGRFFVF